MHLYHRLRKRISVCSKASYLGMAAFFLAIFVLCFHWLDLPKKGTINIEPVTVSKVSVLSAANKSKQRLKQVQRIVQQNNLNSAQEHKKFQDAGWQFVSETPPNHKVLNLDVAALTEYEEQFQIHVQTNTFVGGMLNKVKEVALRTNNSKTRYVALDSLGRSTDPHAQQILVALFDDLSELQDKQQILQLLKPAKDDDVAAILLLREMGSAQTPLAMKQQAAFVLAAHNLLTAEVRVGSDPPLHLINRVPEGFRDEFRSIYQRLQSKRSEN